MARKPIEISGQVGAGFAGGPFGSFGGPASRSPEAMFRQAVGRMREGRYDEARTLCLRILDKRPDDLDARELLGVMALQTGKFTDAADLFARILETQPDKPDHLVNHGSALMALGRNDDAISRFRRALEIDGDHGNAHLNLGLALRRAGLEAESVEPFRQAARLMPKNPAALTNLGIALIHTGDGQQGLDCLRKAVELAPGYIFGHVNLGSELMNRGDHEAALAEFDDALAIEPNAAPIHLERGRALDRLNRHRQAVQAYGQAVTIDDTLTAAHNNLAILMTRRGRAEEAVDHARKAVSQEPRNRDFRLNLGNILAESGRTNEAQTIFESLQQEFPDFAEGFLRQAKIHQEEGSFARARDVIAILKEIDPNPATYFSRLAVDRDVDFSDDELNGVAAIIEQPDTPDSKRAGLCFSLARVLERKERFDEAFSLLLKGNRVRNKTYEYDRDTVSAATDRLIRTFDGDFFAERADQGVADDRPIFIVGMMRSGTSLIEQIIASHRWVGGGGELREFEVISQDLPGMLGNSEEYPECVRQLSDANIKSLARTYLGRLARRFPESRRFTDKLPVNFMHLGLITLLFPRAQVIHCRRAPMDTCFSVFAETFMARHAYAYDMDNLAHFYGEYARLMDHWRRASPIAMLEIDYEDVVADAEGTTRQLLEYCSLDWDEDCLRFHEARRSVRTASKWQVRQPVYSSSVGRWRKFERHLAPLREALERCGVDPDVSHGP
jgi:tetratricopeptide (TPR) repeat protein